MWWYKVLWRGEKRTVSTVNEKDVKFQPKAKHVLARWGGKWWEADVLAKDEDKKKLDRLAFSESGQPITSNRRKGDEVAKEKAKIIETQIRKQDKQLLEKIRDEKSKKKREQEIIEVQVSSDDQALDGRSTARKIVTTAIIETHPEETDESDSEELKSYSTTNDQRRLNERKEVEPVKRKVEKKRGREDSRENGGRDDSPKLKIPTRQPEIQKDERKYVKRIEKKANAEPMERNIYSRSNAEEVKSHTRRETEKRRAANSIMDRQDSQKTPEKRSEKRRKCESPKMDGGNEVENKKRNGKDRPEEKTGKQRQDKELPSNSQRVYVHSESEINEISHSSMSERGVREKKRESDDGVQRRDTDEESVIFPQNYRGGYSQRSEFDSSTDYSENGSENRRHKGKENARQRKNEKNDDRKCDKEKQPDTISQQRKMRNGTDDDGTVLSNGDSGVSRPDVRYTDEDVRMRKMKSSKTVKVNDKGERNRKRKFDDSDEELEKLMTRIKKRKQRKILQNLTSDNDDDDENKVVEIRKNSGIFVNAQDFTDLKLTVSTPGTMATKLMRLALGDDLVGRNAKRGFKIPDNYFRAVYYACCKQFKEHAQDINAYRRTITDLCSKMKVKAKGDRETDSKDRELPTIQHRRKYTDRKDENVYATAGNSTDSSDGEKREGRNPKERETYEEIGNDVKEKGYSDSKSGSSSPVYYDETKSRRICNAVKAEASSHRREEKDDWKMIIEKSMTNEDDSARQRAAERKKAERQNDEERPWDGQHGHRALKVTMGAEVWAEQSKMGDKTADARRNERITPHRVERKNVEIQRSCDHNPRSREKNYREKGCAAGDAKYNNREKGDDKQCRYEKHDQMIRGARDEKYKYSRDRRSAERSSGRDDLKRSRDGRNEARVRSGTDGSTKRRDDSRDRIRGDWRKREKHSCEKRNDKDIGQKMAKGSGPEKNDAPKQRRTV